MKILFAKLGAKFIVNRQKKIISNSIKLQNNVFKKLIKKAQNTQFGIYHTFKKVTNYSTFKKLVPIRNYENFLPYINKIKQGNKNILWPGLPKYWTKTSGTTSGSKYIPITKDSMPYHISSARNALLNYINETKKTDFIKGNMLFLSGSPVLTNNNNILEGRLSGIVNHHIPYYLRRQHLPSFTTNSINDWHEKMNQIIEETLKVNLTLVSGIPPWIQMFFDLVLQKTGACTIKEVFPNLDLIVFGGVRLSPYKKKLTSTLGKPTVFLETYCASEGFIAFQDLRFPKGLLLQTDNGIFYEFIPVNEFFNSNPTRISLADVKIDINYAIIINSNAGLWGYSIGDTVKFISKNPYLIIITGRIKHFISAFGEHVIEEEIDASMTHALSRYPKVEVEEFTVAPFVAKVSGEQSFHEWFIEFKERPTNFNDFAHSINDKLMELNPYYKDLVKDGVLNTLKITEVQKKTFENYMKQREILGGQNKIIHLTNDRKMVEDLMIQH